MQNAYKITLFSDYVGKAPVTWGSLSDSGCDRRVGEDPEFLKSQSPLFRASAISAPLLIAQGTNDPRVKQQESDQIVEALRESNIPVEYLVFENEGHGLEDPANLKRFTALAETFLARSLGGRLETPQPGGRLRIVPAMTFETALGSVRRALCGHRS